MCCRTGNIFKKKFNPWAIYTVEKAPNVPIFLMGILNNEGLLDSVN